MSTTVVEELMLHNRSCPHCQVGEPCLLAEHIQDTWPRRAALQAEQEQQRYAEPADHAAAA